MIAQLRRREAGFLDLARIHLAAAVVSLGTNAQPMARPVALDGGSWNARIAEVYAAHTELERARRLVELSAEADPTCAQQAELLRQKIGVLTEQVAIADALARSGDLLRRGQYDEALQALDAIGPTS